MNARRYSAQRTAIEKELSVTKEHPTAEELYNKLRQRYPSLSLGTVYRNLSNLVTDGFARKMDFSVERYDANTNDHNHFICESCGRVFDLDRGAIPDLKALSKQSGHTIKNSEVIFRGICKLCAAPGGTGENLEKERKNGRS